ncbi:hypothetical protein ACYULU_03465 [Breznakiellaceae bacterium SP9]
MNDTAFSFPQMILIGATGRNKGKTVLTEALIRRLKDRFPIVGLKVSTVAYQGAPCHHGDKGCGACSLLSSYTLEEEKAAGCAGKDTERLLLAGAQRVFWLRAVKTSLSEGFAEFQKQVPPHALVLGESNSLRTVVRPGCFIMVSAGPGEEVKPSAAQVADLAELTFLSPVTAEGVQALLTRLIVEKAPDGQAQVRVSG